MSTVRRGCRLPYCQAQDEIPFPVAWHGAIRYLRRTLADQELGRDETLPAPTGARARHAERPSGAQAGRQLAPQRAASLHVQGLVDRLSGGSTLDYRRPAVYKAQRRGA